MTDPSVCDVEIKEELPDIDESIRADYNGLDDDDVICIDVDKTMQYLAGELC